MLWYIRNCRLIKYEGVLVMKSIQEITAENLLECFKLYPDIWIGAGLLVI